MPATQTVSHLDGSHPADANPPTFESVWAALQETDRMMKEHTQEMKKHAQDMIAIRESQKEAARLIEKNARQMDEYNKRFGDFTNRFGEVVEYMIAPNLVKKFREYGFKFHDAMSDRVFSDDDDNALFEVDIVLQNGEKAMLVEVKTKLTTEDVKEHIERLENMRAYADLHGDKRIFLGAVAGVVMTPHVKKYALGRGF
jgi:predicted XRE-type DNA-binding protein